MDQDISLPRPADLNRLLANSPVLFVMMEPVADAPSFQWVGPNITPLLGYTQAEGCNRDWWLNNIHPDDRERVAFQFHQALRSWTDQVLEYRFATKDGQYRDIRNHIHCPTPVADGAKPPVYQLWNDITELKHTSEQLRALQRAYALLTGANEAAVAQSEPEALYQALCELAISEGQYRLAWVGLVDHATGAVTPVARAGLDQGYVDQVCANIADSTPSGQGPTGRAIRDGQAVICGDIASDPVMGPWRDQALNRGFRSLIALPIRTRDRIIGAFLMYADQVHHFDQAEQDLLIQLANDLSVGTESLHEQQQRQAAERRLQHLAFYDDLTGLPKVNYIRERIAEDPRWCHDRGTCLLLQLERFSEYNHVLGHDVGDRILQTIAQRLDERTTGDQIQAHVAGAKFLLFDPACRSERKAEQLANELLQRVLEPIVIHEIPLEIPAHVGFALAPQHGESFDTLFRNADMARLYASENKLPVANYDTSMELDPERLRLISELRHAIEKNQLMLQYQPKLDLASGTITGAEALVRWQHPDKGVIPPGSFIEMAERTGLVTNITAFVIRQAVRDLKKLEQQGHPLHIAVNVSADDVSNPRLEQFIKKHLEKQRLPPERLTLELTETAMMRDVSQCQETLGALHEAGVNVAIDDFGTGYSSLTYLATLPLHSLKIDRQFIDRWEETPRSQAIVKSTLDMANNLDLQTTAEGVESLAWLSDLKALGCNEAQGFAIAKPMNLASLDGWIANQSPLSIN